MKQLFLLIALAGMVACCTNYRGNGGTVAESLIQRLSDASDSGKFYYFHQDDLVYGHSWKVSDIDGDGLQRSDVKSVCGSFPAGVGFDLGGIELGDSANLDNVPFSLMRRAAVTHYERGGLVTFSWHPRNPLTGGDSWDVSSDKVVASLLENGTNHELFMTWLSRAADFLGSLKDSSGRNIPVIFRPWHENIGSWFWWGGGLCTAEDYKALFRMTRNYLQKDRGLDNLVWSYSPNSGIDSTMYFSRYPGDEYVDILGLDHYEYVDRNNPNRSESENIAAANAYYSQKLSEGLQFINEYAKGHKKLTALTETGFESIPYQTWWTDVLLRSIGDYPICYVLTWRNAWDKPEHYYAPFNGSEDSENFRDFHNSGKALFL